MLTLGCVSNTGKFQYGLERMIIDVPLAAQIPSFDRVDHFSEHIDAFHILTLPSSGTVRCDVRYDTSSIVANLRE